jgi:glutamyl-tRNA reductase
VPAVVALRRHFERIRRSELERLAPKLAALPPEVRDKVEDVTRLMIEKLLLTPTEQLKAIGADTTAATSYAEAISRVFNLDAESAAADKGRVEPFPGTRNRSSSGGR